MSDDDRIMILLVDDRAENLLAYQAILSELNLDLVLAPSGAEALKQVLLHDFAVILLDVNMPGMDGFETAKLIRDRKRSAHTPIIFATGFPDDIQVSRGYAHGAVDYLVTPVVPDILRAKVKVFVALFRMTQQLKRQAEERIALAEERSKREAAEEANQRLSFLSEVGAVVGKSLDYEATLSDVVRVSVPTLGDSAVIVRADPASGVYHLVSASASGDSINVLEDCSFDQIPRKFVDAIKQTLASGKPTFVPDANDDLSDSLHQLVVFPLCGKRSTQAAFGVSREPSGRHFSAADLTTVEATASRAAIALENAQLYEDLEQADQQKNEFLSMLAHELRNPLAPIRNAVELMRLTGNEQPDIAWGRDVIDRQVTHLVRLVDDLLDVSRITGGKVNLDMEAVDAAAIVTAAVETSQPLIEAGGHELSLSIPDVPVWVNCDPVRLAQVLANLLNNAAKYTQQGGLISLSLCREGSHAVFRVRDNGMGVPRDMLAKVFDLFTQVDRSLDRSQGGLGIGLTLVRRLVELHGGTVEATSDGLGRGSEFTVRLPALAPGPRNETKRTSGNRPAENGSPLRVLVVDDNVDAANSVAWLLRLKDHQVQTAHDGQDAVDMAQSFRPQVVVLDLGLPKLDGYEVARRLRDAAETRYSLLVAVSGYGQEEHRMRATAAGFDHHFVKPMNFEELLHVIAQAAPIEAGELDSSVIRT